MSEGELLKEQVETSAIQQLRDLLEGQNLRDPTSLQSDITWVKSRGVILVPGEIHVRCT